MQNLYFKYPQPVPSLGADIVENPDQWQIVLDMPGFSKEDIKMEVEKNTLNISAHQPKNNESLKVVNQEWQPRAVEKSFRLADSVDQANLTATLADGVLQVSIPKKEECKPRKVNIH